MSFIFRGQTAPVSIASFQGYTRLDSKSIGSGDLWLDNANKALEFSNFNQLHFPTHLVYSNVTPATATNPTAAANLMGFSPPAGFLNIVGKGLYFRAYGYTAPVSSATTVTLSGYFGTSGTNVSLFSFATSATVTAANNVGWNLEGYIATATTGATGTLYAQASGVILTGTGTASTSFSSANTAATGAIDLSTATQETLQIQALIGSGNASSTVVQTAFYVWTTN